jgi:tRNA (guanine37-N1)-methyltransferase
MIFDIITIFPQIFKDYFKYSLLKKAIDQKRIIVRTHNLYDFSSERHKKVDDKPYGGGRGMVMKIEPIYKAVSKIKLKTKKRKSKVILFTPRGKKFNQKLAYKLSKLDQIILICGRYEGIDERVTKFVDYSLSIGDYILMGGELPALILIEAVSRYIKGVVGKSEDLIKERITNDYGYIDYPQYTRPEVFSPKKGVYWRVPKVLLSGDHKKIEEWRKKHAKIIK